MSNAKLKSWQEVRCYRVVPGDEPGTKRITQVILKSEKASILRKIRDTGVVPVIEGFAVDGAFHLSGEVGVFGFPITFAGPYELKGHRDIIANSGHRLVHALSLDLFYTGDNGEPERTLDVVERMAVANALAACEPLPKGFGFFYYPVDWTGIDSWADRSVRVHPRVTPPRV